MIANFSRLLELDISKNCKYSIHMYIVCVETREDTHELVRDYPSLVLLHVHVHVVHIIHVHVNILSTEVKGLAEKGSVYI